MNRLLIPGPAPLRRSQRTACECSLRPRTGSAWLSERHLSDGDQPIRLNETNCYGPFQDTVNPSEFIEKTEGSRLRLM